MSCIQKTLCSPNGDQVVRTVLNGVRRDYSLPSLDLYQGDPDKLFVCDEGCKTISLRLSGDGDLLDAGAGSDNSSLLQSAIDSFGTNRGIINVCDGVHRVDSDIDFKSVAIRGVDAHHNNTDVGGTTLVFGGTSGLRTSAANNDAAHHRDITLMGSDFRSMNGQVLLDLTNQNYPRLNNVRFQGGETGLLLNGNGAVESHYGDFYSLDFSRSYEGIVVDGAAATQSHNFYGGRLWDCVVGYVNKCGTSDMKFYGTVFESDLAIRHEQCGQCGDWEIFETRPASTWIFGGRDESDSAPDIQCGSLIVAGEYWSGDRMPATDIYSPAQIQKIPNEILVSGVPGVQAPIYKNSLRNATFASTGGASIDDWIIFGGFLVSVEPSSRGWAARISSTGGTCGMTQQGISVRKGPYRWGFHKNGDAAGLITGRLTAGGAPLVQGVDYSVGYAISTQGSLNRDYRIVFLRDIPDLEFAMFTSSTTAAQVIYYERPYLVPFSHSDSYIA